MHFRNRIRTTTTTLCLLLSALIGMSACGEEAKPPKPKNPESSEDKIAKNLERMRRLEIENGVTKDGQIIMPGASGAQAATAVAIGNDVVGELKVKFGRLKSGHLIIDWSYLAVDSSSLLSYEDIIGVLVKGGPQTYTYVYQPYPTLSATDGSLDFEHREWTYYSATDNASGGNPPQFVSFFPGECAATTLTTRGFEVSSSIVVAVPEGRTQLEMQMILQRPMRRTRQGQQQETMTALLPTPTQDFEYYRLDFDRLPVVEGIDYTTLREETLKRLNAYQSAHVALYDTEDASIRARRMKRMSDEQIQAEADARTKAAQQVAIDLHTQIPTSVFARETLIAIEESKWISREHVQALLNDAPFLSELLKQQAAVMLQTDRFDDWMTLTTAYVEWAFDPATPRDEALRNDLAMFCAQPLKRDDPLVEQSIAYHDAVLKYASELSDEQRGNFHGAAMMAMVLSKSEDAIAQFETLWQTIPADMQQKALDFAARNVNYFFPDYRDAALSRLLPYAKGESGAALASMGIAKAKLSAWGEMDDQDLRVGLTEAVATADAIAAHLSSLGAAEQMQWALDRAEIRLFNAQASELNQVARKAMLNLKQASLTATEAYNKEEAARTAELERKIREEPGAKMEQEKVAPPLSPQAAQAAFIKAAAERAHRSYYDARGASWQTAMVDALLDAASALENPEAAALAALISGRAALDRGDFPRALKLLSNARESKAKLSAPGHELSSVDVDYLMAWLIAGEDAETQKLAENLAGAKSIQRRAYLDAYLNALTLTLRSGRGWELLNRGHDAAFEKATARLQSVLVAAEELAMAVDLNLRAADALQQVGQSDRSKKLLAAAEAQIAGANPDDAGLKALRSPVLIGRIKAAGLAREFKLEAASDLLMELAQGDVSDSLRRDLEGLSLTYAELNTDWQADKELQTPATKSGATVRITFDSGVVEALLYDDTAPNTVANFIQLIEDGWYDDTAVHGVEPHGSTSFGLYNPDFERKPAPGFTIPVEVARKAFRGRLMMERRRPTEKNLLNTEFSIVLGNGRLARDRNRDSYTVYGEITKGMDVVDRLSRDSRIEKVEVLSKRDTPYTPERVFE